ncbi:hypothetical protein ARSEF4850_009991 [Beauveria asiatica]
MCGVGIDWLAGWLAGVEIDWLAGWLAGVDINWLAGWLAGVDIDWLAGWLAGVDIDWLAVEIDWLVGRLATGRCKVSQGNQARRAAANRRCFDYGNAETSLTDTGNGHMEALFFGNTGGPEGSGPWIMAEMENGLFLTQHVDERPPGLEVRHRFVTATLRGKRTTGPSEAKDGAYDPMSKEGAIVLGIGGDNSHTSQGTFYEGAMTAGYPSAEVEDEVQADIARQRYAPASRNSGPAVHVGARVSFRATTACCTTRYIARDPNSDDVRIDFVDSDDQRRRARWVVREGLGSADCYSSESDERPGSFIRHSSNRLVVNANDGKKLFAEDATFCIQAGVNG